MQDRNDIIVKTMEDVMHESMIPYSECVILDRALPRVEDGLKPVQRRILFDMNELGLAPDRPYKKCARVVGDCMGKYHPHGDSSVYQALVRMAQSFNMSATLVEGQGNFGDIDGNGAAAMRYTECRLTPLAMEMLRDMGSPDDEIVRWGCNFDDTLKEPEILPSRFPNLLVNGSSGIAVGLATNIPTHNLAECIDGAVALIDKPRITLAEMMKIIKGPDFPTGGYIIGKDELVRAYETGRGKLIVRAKTHIEADGDKRLIVVDELPYQINKSTLLESILKLREEKKGVLMGISDIADESDRNGIRAVIKVKKDADPHAILKQLFKSTNLSTSFGVNMVAIAEGKPKTLGLLEILRYYVDYQRSFIVKRTKCELDACRRREHILEGLVIAVRNIDEVVKIIKNSQSTTEARENLRSRFSLSQIQADAILDLRLARLTHLEVYKLEKELAQLRDRIAELLAILASKQKQMEVVKNEMLAIKRNFKSPRRSVILADDKDYKVDDKTAARQPVDSCVVCCNVLGQLKRMTVRSFGMSARCFGDRTTANEICDSIVNASGIERVMCFTSAGNCYKIDVADVPEARWGEKGAPFKKICPEAGENEKILYILPLGEKMPKGNVLFYTAQGMVKKTAWSEYNVAKSAFQAIKLRDGDRVIGIETETAERTLLFVSRDGMCLNADMNDIPAQGRVSGGVKGINLREGDECTFTGQVSDAGEIVVVTDKACAKRVLIADVDVMARYRKGVKVVDLKGTNGNSVVFASYVTEPYDIVIKVDDDYLSCFNTEALRIESRSSTGKPLVKGKVHVEDVYIYKTEMA